MKSVWLLGCKGMLGSEVGRLLGEKGVPYFGSDREVDITDPRALQSFARGKSIGWVINCAAYTAVDRAEEEPGRAFELNAEGVRNIAEVANGTGSKLIHISTDYVFDGGKEGAYTEGDPAGPLGVYGRSKLEGERIVGSLVRPHFIVRTAWLYGKNGPNFVSTMLRLFKEGRVVRVVNDQRGSPTYAVDLAGAILEVVRGDSSLYGVYHYTNAGETTWYGFAKDILQRARSLGLIDADVEVQPIRTEEYPTKARRPKNSVLSKEKIVRTFGLKVRSWEAALDEYLRSLAGPGEGMGRADAPSSTGR